MSTSNRLRAQIQYWLVESQYSWMDWRDSWLERHLSSRTVDFITERVQKLLIQRPGTALLCRLYGHRPIPDCSIPEHDYCACCDIPTPGQAARPKRAV